MSGGRPPDGRLTLHVDWTACRGRGLCVELLPEVYGADPWGYPVALEGGGPVAVPRRLERVAQEAVAACPRRALRLAGGVPAEVPVSASGRDRRTR